MMRRLKWFLLVVLFFAQTTFAQRYMGEDPAVMMDLKNVDIMGINIDMPMSDILTTLKARGVNLDCSRGVICSYRSPELILTVQHHGRSKVTKPVDPALTPVSIGFLYRGDDQGQCGVVKKVIAKYCANSVNRQPCWTDNVGQTTGMISASARSADGYRYSSRVVLKKGQMCSLSVERWLN